MSDTLYEQIHNDLVQAKEVYRAEAHRLAAENRKLSKQLVKWREALEEIAGDPVGLSMYQADIAKRALAETDEKGS